MKNYHTLTRTHNGQYKCRNSISRSPCAALRHLKPYSWNVSWGSKGHLLTNSSWSSAKAARRGIFPWDSRSRDRPFNRIAEDILAVRPGNSGSTTSSAIREASLVNQLQVPPRRYLGEMARTKPYQVLGADVIGKLMARPRARAHRESTFEKWRETIGTGTRRR